jgi:hypothetical protein
LQHGGIEKLDHQGRYSLPPADGFEAFADQSTCRMRFMQAAGDGRRPAVLSLKKKEKNETGYRLGLLTDDVHRHVALG